MFMELDKHGVQLVRNATCDGSQAGGSSGQWAFTSNGEVDERQPAPCDFPFSPPSLATPATNRYYDETDANSCSVTYAHLVHPHHMRACVGYAIVSCLLGGVYAYYALQMDRTRTPAMRATHTTKPMQKV